MKKQELEQELDKTQKEVKTLRRELNRIRKNWKYFDAVAKTVMYVAWAYIAYQIARYTIGYGAIWLLGYTKYTETIPLAIVQVLTYAFSLFLIIFVPKLINKKFKTSRKDLGLTELPTFTDIGIAVLGYVATFITAAIIISVLSSLHLLTSEPQQIGFQHLTNGTERAIAYIIIAVIAPIAEEIVFRGWLYGNLRKNLKIVPAMLIVSILFGVLHEQLSVGIYVGILSVFLCLEREITGTIYAGIITHMIQNSIAFAFLIMQGRL